MFQSKQIDVFEKLPLVVLKKKDQNRLCNVHFKGVRYTSKCGVEGQC